MTSSTRLFSPAAERNRQPLLDVLRRVLPGRGRALEIASGSGQHVAWFAHHLPGWSWQPTDADPAALPSIAAWSTLAVRDAPAAPGVVEPGTDRPAGAPGNILAPLLLDVCANSWPVAGDFDLITCA